MTPTFLTLDDLLDSHTEQIAKYGGTHGVRDIGLLESALARPTTCVAEDKVPLGLVTAIV